ncbi:MAG: amidase [Actinomycetota bacterium]
MEELAYLPASEALRMFRSRELSPVELMRAVIERTEAVEPAINAFTETRFDRAIEQAREAENRYAHPSAEIRSIEGLPVALKEKVAVDGWSAQWGSLIYKDNVATHTAPIAERIFGAGGIVHARTTTPEFSIADFTQSRLWGVTRNPWNLEWAVGGSSGGSAASLAAGISALASGSDIGGSIRTPAAFCGIVGYKPPRGRVPVDPPYNLDAYRHDGPMARTVADAALFLNAICGRHPRDAVSLPAIELPSQFEGNASRLKIGLFLHPADRPIDADVEREARAAAGSLAEAGAEVEEVECPWKGAEADRAAMIHWASIWAEPMAADLAKHRELLCDYTIDFVEDCIRLVEESSFYDGLEMEAALWEPVGKLFERFDILICPTVTTRGLVAGESYVDRTLEIGGVQTPAGDWGYLMVHPFNIFSACPVLAVPAGMADNGIPTGVQLIGRPYDDETVFRAGAALEHVRPWLDMPERRPRIDGSVRPS